MKSRSLALALLLTSLASGAATISCHKEGPAERAGKAIDQAADDASEAAKDAGDKLEDAAESAREKAHDATD
jgi:hypothetical protein